MSAPFAYLSATMSLHERPHTLKRGESVSLRYGIALFDGHPKVERIEATCRRWLANVTSDLQSAHSAN